MAQISGPAIVCTTRISPRRRTPVAKSQWTNSACGSIVLLHVCEQRPRDREREEDAGAGNEQRRLDRKPPEALVVRVQKRQTPGLNDRPQDACEDRQRPEQPDCAC